MKRAPLIGTIAGAVLVVGGIGVGAAIASSQPTADPTPSISITATPTVDEPTPSASTAPLVAQEPSADRDEVAFVAFVRARMATYPTQIPDATDADLIATGDIACERVAAGEGGDDMTIIEGEQKTDAGYYTDTGVIVAAAQLHLCPETIK